MGRAQPFHQDRAAADPAPEPGTSLHGPDSLPASLALSGYGHFTTMLVEQGAVRGLSLHLARLSRDCRTVFGTDLDPGSVLHLLRGSLPHPEQRAVARITVHAPCLSITHPALPVRPQLHISLRNAPAAPPDPMRVSPFRFVRQVPQVKHTSLFETLYVRRQAQVRGFDDALLVAPGAHIAEGATWNVGFVDAGTIVWPRADQLPGITMALLKRVHPYETRPVRLRDLPRLQAAFATNAVTGVRPLAAIGPVNFPTDHPVLRELGSRYARIRAESLSLEQTP